jgi:hypothetical protein
MNRILVENYGSVETMLQVQFSQSGFKLIRLITDISNALES